MRKMVHIATASFDALTRLARDKGQSFQDLMDEAITDLLKKHKRPMIIGTPDDLVKMIKDVYAKSGGFGTVVGFVHDWANPENTFRSWDLVARYVVPEINGYVAKLRESERHLQVNRGVFERASKAIMTKIMENKDAAEALKVTQGPRFAAAGAQVPKEIADKGKQEAAE